MTWKQKKSFHNFEFTPVRIYPPSTDPVLKISKADKIVLIFKELRESKLYQVLKTMPKGVIHHVHFDCC